jgi:hypothetical protein
MVVRSDPVPGTIKQSKKKLLILVKMAGLKWHATKQFTQTKEKVHISPAQLGGCFRITKKIVKRKYLFQRILHQVGIGKLIG